MWFWERASHIWYEATPVIPSDSWKAPWGQAGNLGPCGQTVGGVRAEIFMLGKTHRIHRETGRAGDNTSAGSHIWSACGTPQVPCAKFHLLFLCHILKTLPSRSSMTRINSFCLVADSRNIKSLFCSSDSYSRKIFKTFLILYLGLSVPAPWACLQPTCTSPGLPSAQTSVREGLCFLRPLSLPSAFLPSSVSNFQFRLSDYLWNGSRRPHTGIWNNWLSKLHTEVNTCVVDLAQGGLQVEEEVLYCALSCQNELMSNLFQKIRITIINCLPV